MSNTHEFDEETFQAYLDSLPDVAPPPRLKDAVFASLDEAVAAGPPTSQHLTSNERADVIDVDSRRGRSRWMLAAAAAVLVIVVGGVSLFQFLPEIDSSQETQLAEDTNTADTNTADSAPNDSAASQPDAQQSDAQQSDAQQSAAEPSGAEQMHAIMEADDLMHGDAKVSGARLDIVSSTEMGKSGAMVDGQPVLDDGMGAQVWAVSSTGEVTSAGVIGPDPHDDVWMPFAGDAMKVMVTEEPMSGSATPTGRMLAEVELSA